MANYSCSYCVFWSRTKIIKRNEGEKVKRKCQYSKGTISFDSPTCKFFNPAELFNCQKNGHYIAFIACLNRRRNPAKLETFEACKKCKQFETEISKILQDYWINLTPITKPKNKINSKRTITRRNKKQSIKTKRVIRRRDKKLSHKPKRTIKKRDRDAKQNKY